MKPFFAQIERDLLIAWQNRQDLGVMLVFFVIIIALFPLAIGANASVLDPLGVPVIWIAALLAILAGFDLLFAQDVRDGWLDQIALSQLGLGWYALAKAISHWITAGLPLLIMTPVNGNDAEYSVAAMAAPFGRSVDWQHGIDPSWRDWRSPCRRGAARHRIDGFIDPAAGGAIAYFRHACFAK